jgi:hypothetical protein
MAPRRYHGSFDHPVRAFAIGMTLLVLLFGGFVIGIEAGTKPTSVSAAVRTVTIDGQTVTLPGDTKTVTSTILKNGKTILVQVPGEQFTRVITVRDDGSRFVVGVVAPARTTQGGRVVPASVVTLTEAVPVPAVTLPATTVTETATETSTVTETATSTVTETVTASSSGADSTSTP